MAKQIVSFSLDPSLAKELKKFCLLKGLSQSSFINNVIKDRLAEQGISVGGSNQSEG